MSIPKKAVTHSASALVAIIIASALGLVTMVLFNLNPAQNRPSQTAALYVGVDSSGAAITPGGTPTATTPATTKNTTQTTTSQDPIAKACATAISQAKASGTDAAQKQGQDVEDNCVAAIKTPDPAYASTGGYKCVGKNANVTMKTDGSVIINWTANPNMAPGVCKTLACTPNSDIGATGKCVLIKNQYGINQNTISTALAGSNTFDVSRSPAGVTGLSGLGIGSDYVTPTSELSQSDLNTLYSITGDTSGTIPIDSNKYITGASYDQLVSNLGGNTDPSALAAQQAVTNSAAQLNPDITANSIVSQDFAALNQSGVVTTDSHGSYAYPITAADATTYTSQGFTCDTNGTGNGGYSCFKPAPDATAQPSWLTTAASYPITPTSGFQGPCQAGLVTGPTGCIPAPATPAQTPYFQPYTGPVTPPSSMVPFGGTALGNPLGATNPLAQNMLFYQAGQMLGSLISGNGFGAQQQPQMACATNQDQYQQQQQQYSQQIQQYNMQLQQYQYQQQQMQMQQQMQLQQLQLQQLYGGNQIGMPIGYGMSPMYGAPMGYGGMQPPPPPQLPQPCYNNQNPQQCSYSPPQPASSGCTSGVWQATTSGNGCVSGWQCIPNGATTGGSGTTPSATISCQPKIADVGMTLAISYACANATGSSGAGFNTGGALSGSATTIIQTPPPGFNTATYTLTCNNNGVTAGAQCSIQVGNPSIIFIANPSQVQAGASSTIGWITSGMQSCVVSSPDMPSFTSENAQYTNTNGITTASPITSNTQFLLHCTSVGGTASDASTTVTVY